MNWDRVARDLSDNAKQIQDSANYAATDQDLKANERFLKAVILDSEARIYRTLAAALKNGLL